MNWNRGIETYEHFLVNNSQYYVPDIPRNRETQPTMTYLPRASSNQICLLRYATPQTRIPCSILFRRKNLLTVNSDCKKHCAKNESLFFWWFLALLFSTFGHHFVLSILILGFFFFLFGHRSKAFFDSILVVFRFILSKA